MLNWLGKKQNIIDSLCPHRAFWVDRPLSASVPPRLSLSWKPPYLDGVEDIISAIGRAISAHRQEGVRHSDMVIIMSVLLATQICEVESFKTNRIFTTRGLSLFGVSVLMDDRMLDDTFEVMLIESRTQPIIPGYGETD